MSIDPTDVDRLPVPLCLQQADLGSRASQVHEHDGRINADWWNRKLEELGLPGGPVSGQERRRGNGSVDCYVSRGDVFALAWQLDQGEAAVLRLLWHALAWGSGFELMNKGQLLATIAEDVPRAVAILREAAGLARQQPEAAYRRLWTGRRGELKYLGPAFLTKFLYFVGGGCQNHLCLILDRRVARTLVRCGGWASLATAGGWPAWTYGRYCRLARRWAVEETVRRHRVVCPDEVERWLWEHSAAGCWSPTRRLTKCR